MYVIVMYGVTLTDLKNENINVNERYDNDNLW